MAKKPKPKEVFPTLELRGRITQTHPTWGGGRPILVGDTAKHREYGVCRVAEIHQQTASIIDKNKFNHNVNIAELWFDVTQVPHLAEAKSWPALLGKQED